MFNSLRIKIFLLFTIGLFIGLSIVIAIFSTEVSNSYKELFIERATNSAKELKLKTEQLLELGLFPEEFSGYEKLCEQIRISHEGISYLALFDNKNNAIYQSGNPKFYKEQKGLLRDYVIKLGVESSTNLNISIFAIVDKKVIDEKTYNFLKSVIICVFIALLFVILIAVVYININLGKPLDSLLNRIKRVNLKNSDEGEWLLLKRKDEIGLVSREFHDLIEKLLNTQNALSKSNEELIQLNEELDSRVEEELKKNREKDLQLIEQSKMASIADVISNIAHQWRQPLSAISAISTGLQLQKEFDDLSDKQFLEGMDKINEQSQKLSKTIDTFRDFIGNDNEIKEIVVSEKLNNIVSIVNEAIKSKGIILKTDIDKSNDIKLKVIPSEFNQAILNIINNAKEHLIDRKIKDPYIKLNLVESGSNAIITIEDNAGGIIEENLPHLFEPYFTTKHQSQGTGMGLHISYKIIVEVFKGKLYVQNTECGATFFIELPLS